MAANKPVVYVRLTAVEKLRLDNVLRAIGNVSQQEYARRALLAAVERDRVKYAAVIEKQKELEP